MLYVSLQHPVITSQQNTPIKDGAMEPACLLQNILEQSHFLELNE